MGFAGLSKLGWRYGINGICSDKGTLCNRLATRDFSGEHRSSLLELNLLLRDWVEAHNISELAVKRSAFQFGLQYAVEFNLGLYFESG